MHVTEVTEGRTLLATLEHGASLIEELEALATETDLESAWFVGWGAVQDADIASVDQDAFEPESVSFTEPLELPFLTGTITRTAETEGRPSDEIDQDGDTESDPSDAFEVTARAVLARPSGQALAGVLESATVFGVEVSVQEYEEPLVREPDDATDMSLLSL